MRLPRWLKRRRLDDQDFSEEIRAHLAMAAADKVADGVDREDARYAALREFGNVTLTTEAARGVWTPRWVRFLVDAGSDALYAVRALRKSPAFAVTVIAVLAIGIGLNAAVFTMLKGMALSPLAGVSGSAAIAVIAGETAAGRAVRISYPDYEYLRDHHDGFVNLFGTAVSSTTLGRGKGARQIWTEVVSGNYFQALRVGAERGRTLVPSDAAAPGDSPVVVISHALWQREFAADPAIVGKTIEINNQPLTVVGVASATFHGTIVTYDIDAFVPITMAPQLGFTFGSQETTPAGILSDRRAGVFYPEGFLRRGVSLDGAAARSAAMWNELSRERPQDDPVARLKVVRFWETPGSGPTFILPTLTVVSAMGLLVLLVACANIAGLVLVRGISRRGEIAVRLALGATRGRIVRLLVAENLVLALPGALLGVLLATNGLDIFVGYAEQLATPDRVYFNNELDGLVVGFAVLVACGCALVFGFVPALQSTRFNLLSAINEDASPRGASRGRFRSGLVVAQVAVSLVLLFGAGLVTRSLDAARNVYPGFDERRVTAVSLDLRRNAYDEARGSVFYRKLLDAARVLPGVESASLSANLPLGLLDTRAQRVSLEGYAARRDEDLAFMSNIVTPGYFETLRIPLLAGRDFTDHDGKESAAVAIVNATLAERFWGSPERAVGKRLRVGQGPWKIVVGVAADLKYSRVDEAPRPYFYVPLAQSYHASMELHTRGASAGAPSDEALVGQARALVESLDADLPIINARSLAETRRGAVIFYTLAATMLLVFGVAGLVLAGLGTYGLVSYSVRQSTHEIGIRMALGASGSDVVRQFLLRGLRLGAIGAAAGIVAAVGIGRVVGSILFGVSASDPWSFARALVIVLGGVVVATIVPAWRAARTNPLRALHHQ